jgi:LysM repeat protein
MKKIILFLFIVFCINELGVAFSISSTDSVGTIIKDGKSLILHEVEPGETLYALSRKYGIDVQAIKKANGESLNSLKVGQKVLIPFQSKNVIKDGKLHTVMSSETLFSISRKYNVKVDDLKKWNDLTDNTISVGQQLLIRSEDSSPSPYVQNSKEALVGKKLHTVTQSQTLFSISQMYGVTTDELKEWNSLKSNAINIGQVLVVSNSNIPVEPETVQNSSMLPNNENAAEMVDEQTKTAVETHADEVSAIGIAASGVNNSADTDEEIVEKPKEKIVQKGLAEVIENTSETKKYLALHRDAPVGTIMQVRNEMNNQSVFVRVVGPIPATGDNSKVILKISKKAYDRLGAVDNRFPVEISFIP